MAVPRPEPPSSPRDDLPPFVFAGKTDTGRRRSSNQDRFLATTVGLPGGPATLLAVADGMGGAAGGEVASGHAVEELTRVLGQALPERSSGDLLSDGIAAANRTIYEHAQAEPALYGMGTTLVAVLVAGDQMIVAHVGDSRAGLVRDGTLRRLTADHSWVAEQVRLGIITDDEARTSNFRNVLTRAVGVGPSVGIEVSEAQAIQPGDILVLCSDGLHGVVDDSTIASIVVQAEPPDAVQQLIDLANERGGPDNVTVVIGRLGGRPISTGPDQNRIPTVQARAPARADDGVPAAIAAAAEPSSTAAPKPTTQVLPTREAMNAARAAAIAAGRPASSVEEPAAPPPRPALPAADVPVVGEDAAGRGRLIALGVAGALVVLAVIALIFSAGAQQSRSRTGLAPAGAVVASPPPAAGAGLPAGSQGASSDTRGAQAVATGAPITRPGQDQGAPAAPRPNPTATVAGLNLLPECPLAQPGLGPFARVVPGGCRFQAWVGVTASEVQTLTSVSVECQYAANADRDARIQLVDPDNPDPLQRGAPSPQSLQFRTGHWYRLVPEGECASLKQRFPLS